MSYLIRIMYGKDVATTQRFRFDAMSNQTDDDFDKAVKDLNQIYKERGRFDTQQEIIEHFKKYGYNRIAI